MKFYGLHGYTEVFNEACHNFQTFKNVHLTVNNFDLLNIYSI